jgi:hypothetical protein
VVLLNLLVRLAKRAAQPVSGCLGVALISFSAWSQSGPGTATSVSVAPNAPKPSLAASNLNGSTAIEWSTLSAAQQLALRPLQGNWTSLSDQQKRKWLSLSANFPRMNADDQTKLHSRMAQWAALSPRQREQARLNYAEVQKISPVQKNEKWEAYQALDPNDKKKLAATAKPKPPRTALATNPAPSDKINQVPLIESAGRIRLPVPMADSPGQTLLVKPLPSKRPAATRPVNASSTN